MIDMHAMTMLSHGATMRRKINRNEMRQAKPCRLVKRLIKCASLNKSTVNVRFGQFCSGLSTHILQFLQSLTD